MFHILDRINFLGQNVNNFKGTFKGEKSSLAVLIELASKIENIEIQIGRTGALTPVAKIKPVNIGDGISPNKWINNIENEQLNVIDQTAGTATEIVGSSTGVHRSQVIFGSTAETIITRAEKLQNLLPATLFTGDDQDVLARLLAAFGDELDEIKAFAAQMIKGQMAQFGQLNPSKKEVEDIVARVLSNKDEVKRMSQQLTSQKLLAFYKENVKIKVKKLSYDAFVKEVYGK